MVEIVTVPTVNGSDFFSGTDAQRRQFCNDMVDSFKRFGFVKLINHGIPQETVNDVFYWTKRFYRLPTGMKQKAAHPPGPNPQRGWSGIGVESTASLYGEQTERPTGELKDEKEHYDIGPPNDPEFPNRWPEESDIPGWRSFMEGYYDRAQSLCLQIMSALEIGLGLPPDTLVERCVPSASELRLNRYPAVTIAQLRKGDTARIWPHTDFGLITLLLQDNAGGLEVEDQTEPGRYIPVPPEDSYEIIVNISDTFERWVNGVIKAGVHQVTVPHDRKEVEHGLLKERWSVAHLFKAHRQAMVGPLKQFVTAERPAKFDDITALQFQKRRTGLIYSVEQVTVKA